MTAAELQKNCAKPYGFLTDKKWLKSVLRDAFGKVFFNFLLFAALAGLACYLVLGADEFREALAGDVAMLLKVLPRATVALSVAALLWVILPTDGISRLVGQESGYRGLIIAAAAGTVTPGGPSSAYALLAMLGASGADRGAMVAFISAWATLGLQRILIWDVPFMGEEFSIIRFAVCLPMPVIAGLIARRLPFDLTLKTEPKAQQKA